MAEPHDEDLSAEDADIASGYAAPAQKSVQEIVSTDAEDESLRKYKEALLGTAVSGGVIEVCKYCCKLYLYRLIAKGVRQLHSHQLPLLRSTIPHEFTKQLAIY